MKYLLDSNIIILIAEALNERLRQRLGSAYEDDLVTSSIVYAEVLHGSVRGKPPPFAQLERLATRIPVLPFDYAASRAYATLPFRRASYDRLIAAHALSLELTLVTANEEDFGDVPGLKIENWTLPL